MHLARHTRPLLAALVLALACSTGTAAASVAGTTLPLTGFSHMLVDGAHGHVFLTGGAADSKIVVRNPKGTTAGTITGESGAGGMVLDGSTLYVARCGWGVITRSTPRRSRRWAAPPPRWAAPATWPRPAAGCGTPTRPISSSATSNRCRSTRRTPSSTRA